MRHRHWWVWSGPTEGLKGYEHCHRCGQLPPSIEVEAFPGSRDGHTEGPFCRCVPFRDTEVATVLVHRKVGRA